MSASVFSLEKPSITAAQDLDACFVDRCRDAAAIIREAHAVLLVTGHGWAKEAGMITPGSVHTNTIYAERKLDYGTLSRAALLEEDPSLFYGFWGWQYNKDLATPPHPTHEIIGQWRERLLQNTEFEAKLHAMMARKTGELKKALLLKGGGSKAGREAEKNVRRVLAPVRAMMENPSYVKRLSTARSNQARRGQNSVSHSSHSSLVSRTTVPSSPPASLSPPCPLPNRVSARDVLFEGRSKRRSKRKVFLPSSSETKYRGTGGTGKAGALFSYSCTIDSSWREAGFSPNELYQIHGNIQRWQCSRKCGGSDSKISSGNRNNNDNDTGRQGGGCSSSPLTQDTRQVWSPDREFRFNVDHSTMLATSPYRLSTSASASSPIDAHSHSEQRHVGSSNEHIRNNNNSDRNGTDSNDDEEDDDVSAGSCCTLFRTRAHKGNKNSEEGFEDLAGLTNGYAWEVNYNQHPICSKCKGPARPAVMMEGDVNWVSNVSEARRYQLWRASVKELLLQEPGYRIAIVELGCSLDEPSTRKQSEQYLSTLPANQASLIRVNKEYPLCKRYPDQSICLMSSAESALSQIDAFIQRPPSSSPASLPRQCRYFPNSDGPTPALPRADTPGHDEHTRTRGHTRVYSDDIDIDIDLRAEVDRENNNSEHARGKCCDPAPLHGSLGNRIKEKDSEAPAPKKERKGNIDGPTTGGYGSFHSMRDSQSGILPPLDPLSFSFTSVQPLSSSSSPSLPFPCKLTSLQK